MTDLNDKPKMMEMMIRGTNFKDYYDYELYGEEVTAILRPLTDDTFLPIAAFLSAHFDMEGDDGSDEAVAEALDTVEEAEPDIGDLSGVGADLKSRLISEGYEDLEDVADADPDELVQIDGIGEERAESLPAEAEELVNTPIDVSKLDKEFVAAMQRAAEAGLYGEFDAENQEEIEYSEDEAENFVSNLMGGYSVELGGRVLELSGDVRKAEKFRGSRGRVERSRNK